MGKKLIIIGANFLLNSIEEGTVDRKAIYYTSTDGNTVSPAGLTSAYFGVECTGNVYDLEGKLSFADLPTKIVNRAFYGKSTLQTIRIPSSVKTIGSLAFASCTELTTIEGLASLEYWGDSNDSPVWKCPKLIIEDVNMPNLIEMRSPFGGTTDPCKVKKVTNLGTITSVPTYAFFGSNTMTEAHLPSTVTNIGNQVFQNCSSLTDLYVAAVNPPTLGRNPFYNANALAHIHVPAGSVDAYKSAEGWSAKASLISE